jgi:hypothetical protein
VIKFVSDSISEKTYKEISRHKQDKTYVRTSAVEKAMKFLHEHGVVILSGREGTGKYKVRCIRYNFM